MVPVYNKLSDFYDALFLEHISRFRKNLQDGNQPDKDYVVFYPGFGTRKEEKAEFLVYGQAVNGWEPGFGVYEKPDNKLVEKSVEFSNSWLEKKGHCPLDWVNVAWSDTTFREHCADPETRDFYSDITYRVFRSFFWNVTYKLVCDYYGLSRSSMDWAKRMVWSNLYKIAPDGFNPGIYERELQQPLCCELVKREIEEIAPRFCIVITGYEWWKPFREFLKPESLQTSPLPADILHYDRYKNTRIILTNRPRAGDSDDYVNQILGLIKG